MPQFTYVNFDYSNVSLNEGYKLWRQHEGLRTYISGGYSCRGKIISGPHWTGKWVGTKGLGNQGAHYIVPVSKEAKKLVRIHITECWVNRYDISYRQADLLWRCRARYKYELIAQICAAIKDESCHAAFACFPGVGPDSHLDWLDRWGEVVEDYMQQSWPRNAALIEIVNFVISGGVYEIY